MRASGRVKYSYTRSGRELMSTEAVIASVAIAGLPGLLEALQAVGSELSEGIPQRGKTLRADNVKAPLGLGDASAPHTRPRLRGEDHPHPPNPLHRASPSL